MDHWKKWEKFLSSSIQPFWIFTLTLLSLLYPLSILLLSRLSTVHYLISTLNPDPSSLGFSSFFFSLFLYTNQPLLHFLVSLFSITALLHGLTPDRFTFLSETKNSGTLRLPGLYVSWIFLCTLQVCVGLGIEATIAAGAWLVHPAGAGNEKTLLRKITLFIGLHETMLHWSRTVVRPVMVDAAFGGGREEKWEERVAMAAGFGMLWWWRLRDEVESLVVVVEMKRRLLVDVGVADLVGWWLYYLTVAIGLVRLIKGLMWFGKVLICRGIERKNPVCLARGDDKV